MFWSLFSFTLKNEEKIIINKHENKNNWNILSEIGTNK
tara:strand:- start:32 stop:145 length:114 start_codon:yes stop_codon:yes gene_type:complete